MSRSCYCEDGGDDSPFNILWPSIVRRAIRGKRGQAFLSELAREMDAMPVKKLIAEELVTKNGDCCTIGVVYKSRGIDPDTVCIDSPEQVGAEVNISMAMAAEIEYRNDECGPSHETDEQRWVRMREWVRKNTKE